MRKTDQLAATVEILAAWLFSGSSQLEVGEKDIKHSGPGQAGGSVMAEPDTLRVHIPLTLRNRGGRPRILPPKEIEVAMDRGQDARLLRAIGRAWDWRRRLERGDVNTIADLAREEGISDRYVSRVIRLAWLSPSVLERLVLRREPTVLSIFDLCGVAELPWAEQPGRVFD